MREAYVRAFFVGNGATEGEIFTKKSRKTEKLKKSERGVLRIVGNNRGEKARLGITAKR